MAMKKMSSDIKNIHVGSVCAGQSLHGGGQAWDEIINLTHRDVCVVVGDAVRVFPTSGVVAVLFTTLRSQINVVCPGNDMMIDVDKRERVVVCLHNDGEADSDIPDQRDGVYYIVARGVAEVVRRRDLLVCSDVISTAGAVNCTKFEAIY